MREAFSTLFGQKLPAPVEGAIEKLLRLDRLNRLWEDVPGGDDRLIAGHPLALLNVHPQVSERDLALIPKQGPVVAVANHPFGLIEGAILPSLFLSVRPDVKVMANHLLAAMPETNRLCIYVDPYGGEQAARANRKGLKDAIGWLKQGGLLTVFPAGEVSQLNLKERSITDPEWNQHVARLIRITGATVLPVYLLGGNSAWFHLLGCLHPRMRTALLPHEFFNKHNRDIEVRIGSPITPAKIRAYQDDVALIRYLRRRTYLLENREAPRRFQVAPPEPVAGVLSELLAGEVAKLGPERSLVSTEDFTVLLAKAGEIPNVLHEIGRLREVTFRQVGEGTGKPVDLDRFDDHYWHLFVWNRHACEVAGAYRLGPSDEILPRFGPKGFYTSQLFQWKQTFLDRISPALELGRSFVRPEYQKTYAPLLLLWKGIGQFLIRNPQYKLLFGPVSISNGYTTASRQLMVKFLSAYRQSQELAPLVRARNPFRQRSSNKFNDELMGAAVWDIEELSTLIADVETDRKGVPVLLKQYLKLGGELVAFHVDRRFADALDGLIVVDLRKTDARVLERYMGKDGAAQFLRS
jgi:putative hemolysin